jgi:DhnA family fructose-bisphosphate aldolase class Ia
MTTLSAMPPLPPRLHRLFAADGRCFDVAVDHGFFNEGSFLSGIEDMPRAVGTLVDAAPDAIQLSPGQAPLLQDRPGPRKPALVLRTDVANVYHRELPRTLYSEVIEDAVQSALRLDAACVVVNLLLLPDQPELLRQTQRNVMALRAACDPVGMPLMVEPLVFKPGTGGYGVDGDPEKIVPLVRQAAELGEDVIKADPTDDLDEYHRVIEAAGGRPVLPRGGGRVPDEEVLARTAKLMQQGAAGIVYGRNVIQHDDPAGMTRALMAVVHEGTSAADALELIRA